jgi:hypothetical protein
MLLNIWHLFKYCIRLNAKAKAVPLHVMEALEGERRYSSYSFLASELDFVNVQRHAPAAL